MHSPFQRLLQTTLAHLELSGGGAGSVQVKKTMQLPLPQEKIQFDKPHLKYIPDVELEHKIQKNNKNKWVLDSQEELPAGFDIDLWTDNISEVNVSDFIASSEPAQENDYPKILLKVLTHKNIAKYTDLLRRSLFQAKLLKDYVIHRFHYLSPESIKLKHIVSKLKHSQDFRNVVKTASSIKAELFNNIRHFEKLNTVMKILYLYDIFNTYENYWKPNYKENLERKRKNEIREYKKKMKTQKTIFKPLNELNDSDKRNILLGIKEWKPDVDIQDYLDSQQNEYAHIHTSNFSNLHRRQRFVDQTQCRYLTFTKHCKEVLCLDKNKKKNLINILKAIGFEDNPSKNEKFKYICTYDDAANGFVVKEFKNNDYNTYINSYPFESMIHIVINLKEWRDNMIIHIDDQEFYYNHEDKDKSHDGEGKRVFLDYSEIEHMYDQKQSKQCKGYFRTPSSSKMFILNQICKYSEFAFYNGFIQKMYHIYEEKNQIYSREILNKQVSDEFMKNIHLAYFTKSNKQINFNIQVPLTEIEEAGYRLHGEELSDKYVPPTEEYLRGKKEYS